jgi:4-diphosphocytidyl-2-C-methyl-D-erythritol kinase
MPQRRIEPAPAKINLTLHVTGQRADGYHLLDSLVAFATIGDVVTVEAADTLSLTIDGPFAAGLCAADNLVLRAARLLDGARGAHIRLTKNLPVASGIGGGSADAAATLRALSQLWGVALPDGLALGADVPACIAARTLRLQGVGDIITPLPALPPMEVVLVNPGVSVPTPLIFNALTSKKNTGMPAQLPTWQTAIDFAGWLAHQRNDLYAPAAQIAPQINDVLTMLRKTTPLFVGMSGSGATCFGLYHPGEANRARILLQRPGWWVAAGQLIRNTT